MILYLFSLQNTLADQLDRQFSNNQQPVKKSALQDILSHRSEQEVVDIQFQRDFECRLPDGYLSHAHLACCFHVILPQLLLRAHFSKTVSNLMFPLTFKNNSSH